MAIATSESGRINQKRRTRGAIVQAARVAVAEGRAPTLEEVADAALVSRTTAYRYFPSIDALLTEVALDGIRDTVEPALQAVTAETNDVAVRLNVLMQAIQGQVVLNEAGFRALLRMLVTPAPGDEGRLRQGRRLAWIEAALAPARDRLDERAFDRLVAALALCMGIESLVVLRDVCALDPEAAAAVGLWAAQALLAAALAEPA